MTLARKLIVSAGLLAGLFTHAIAADITGAGATFPYPLYAKWAEQYKAKTGIGLNYQSIGSGGGIKQIQAKTVDFGASDMPLKPEELDKSGLLQFPTVVGGVVPVINVPGVKPGQVKLSNQVLADIYLGKIKKWNDPALTALNAGVALPDQNITVVRRSDGSGTTFLFTDYLSKVSPEWKEKVGSNTSVQWPAGVGGKGNEGVANYVQRIKGSIGYVEFAYAKQNKMIHTQLQNKEGAMVEPSEESFKAAAAGADWKSAPGMYLVMTNAPGKTSWPIASATFILMYKKQDNAKQAAEVLKFFDWAYANGDATALDLDYIPMPDSVVNMIKANWTAQITDGANKIWK
ncbi:phosphate ABC transporter substrate-binding protein PstS [Chitinibacter bivalviorum]|uniref:Phosphate-binding protein PstS n=1 Tax=Chitinibacter bivalviorum TaxID=2739434 RepID=A0A7H9BIQ8_9NEIS|nr:phosphate ABC transporter substrate-binding protein PstS [Chitinibacter bivalviorum]QLG88359.1 phosphate ABC transporter substrate-binding protein PstS [Chitinibacter bivalviorum]